MIKEERNNLTSCRK